jgi:very-short-patch-repair endonuclease
MIIEVKTIRVARTSPRSRKTKRVIVYQCDQCQKIYEGKYQKKYMSDRKFHLCSKQCLADSRRNGGVAVEHQLQSRDMKLWQSRVKQTLQDRYGVDNPSSLDWVKQKKIETYRLHYGVDHPQKNPEVSKRSIETYAKRYHNRWISKPEKKFGELLIEEFGSDNVKLQKLIERKWSVDFYITSIDIYIQFDGVYWHGLDRPIDEIRQSTKVRDTVIYKKWVKDRELDVYMIDRGLKLVRITDVQFSKNPQGCINTVKEFFHESTVHNT